MVKEIKHLKFYQEPVYYSGLISLICAAVYLYSVFVSRLNTSFDIPLIIFSIIFGALAYYLWITKCPNCKRPFSKKEKLEWKEDLGIRNEPYTYYSKVIQYSDGTSENVIESKKTIMRNKKYEKEYYICKNCDYGLDKEWNEEKGTWLGEKPKPQIIRKKGSAINVNTGFDQEYNSNKKSRIPISMKIKRIIFERAGNACQHCGNNDSLDIHHIDENPSNNSKSNLIVLCPSCHRKAKIIPKIALQNESKKEYKKVKTVNIYK
jgi:hypothetical protein